MAENGYSFESVSTYILSTVLCFAVGFAVGFIAHGQLTV